MDNFGLLAQYVPTECRSRGTIIITTQKDIAPQWLGDVRIIPVKNLDSNTAADGIFKYLRRNAEDETERKMACDIANHVGGLPLAIATIGGYVNQSKISLEECFENIKHKATLWERASKVQDIQPYERSLIDVFDRAFKDLKDPARELLNVLAFLDPDSVPEEIFAKAIDRHRFVYINSIDDFPACHFELHSRQLIRRDTMGGKSSISIHRAVQQSVLLDLRLDLEKRKKCFQQTFAMVRDMLPETDPKAVPEAHVWPAYDQHGRQILQLQTHSVWPDPPIQLPKDFAQILADMGQYMWFAGKFPDGVNVLRSAEAILDDNKAKWNDDLRAHVYGLLGIITSFEGASKRKESMEHRKAAYSAREHSHIGRKAPKDRTRDEDIMVWNMYSDLAFGHIQEENFEHTEHIMERCLGQYQEWEPDELLIPFEYSKYYQLISFCHMANERPDKALETIERCYELIQKAAGEKHPMRQLIKFCRAMLLWHRNKPGDRQLALQTHKAVLQERKKLLGEFSHFTLESYSTCGKLCLDSGEVEQAKQFLIDCLQERKQEVWSEEGITRAKFRYANVLKELARQIHEPGEAIRAKALVEEAHELMVEVHKVIQRYRKMHAEYMPTTSEDAEQNLDQMVSFWVRRLLPNLLLRRVYPCRLYPFQALICR